MSNIGEQMTFWTLINKYNICIPIIQRDYVQGRDSPQVKDARKNLLQDMHGAITGNGNVDLNFVYGKVHEKNEEKIFIPLDGQQRLTTLFLIHWFALGKEQDFERAKILARFSYETRISSRRFIEQLVQNITTLATAMIDVNKKISDEIEDEAWFRLDWKLDPTIASILVMLDEIKAEFINVDGLADKLTQNTGISFRFLSMNDLGMEDSLYIKLNARGRGLTDFENFKAELAQYVKKMLQRKEMNETIAKNFPSKLDGKWTDLFWRLSGDEKRNFDSIYMNCFHWMLWNRWAEKQEKIEKTYSNIVGDEMGRTTYYRLKNYTVHGAIDGEVLRSIYDTLEYFSDWKHNSGNEMNFFGKCVSGSGDEITYADRVMMFAVSQYISRNYGMIDSAELTGWLRVCKNLVVNSQIDNLERFIRSIQSIANLSNHSSDLLTYLASPDCNITFFLGEQIEEERLKAKLILHDRKWAEAIYHAEKHPYFEGQIGFLLSFAGLNLQNVDDIEEVQLATCLNGFANYERKMAILFNKDGLQVDNELFSRAVLSKGDYLFSKGSCRSFLVNKHRDISWKNLLKNSRAEQRAFLQGVVEELDGNELSLENIVEKLREIIDKVIIAIDDWRYYLVKMRGVLTECGFKNSGAHRLIYQSSEGRILLVPDKSPAGKNKEYYTWVLYLELLSQGMEVHYCDGKGRDGEMFIDTINGKKIMINYKPVDSEQELSTAREFQISYMGGAIHAERTVDDALIYINTLL